MAAPLPCEHVPRAGGEQPLGEVLRQRQRLVVAAAEGCHEGEAPEGSGDQDPAPQQPARRHVLYEVVQADTPGARRDANHVEEVALAGEVRFVHGFDGSFHCRLA